MTAKKLLRIDESCLPENWKGATLADVTEYIQRGKGPKYIERSDLPVINQKCIRWFGIQKEHLKYVDPEQWSAWGEERYVRVGDVLWNSTGTGTIGRAAIVRDLALGEKYVVDSHVTIVRPRGIDPQYVHYWIMSPSVQGSIEAMQSGSTNQVELSKSAVETLPIPVAPLEQQKRIVAEIEKQFSRLDEAVANLKRVKANLKRYKAAVLKAAVEGKLTEDWRKQHPNVEPASKLLERILPERRAKWRGKGTYKEPAVPDTSNSASLPKEWVWAGLEQLTSAVRVICYGILMPKENIPNGILYVKVKDFKGDRIDLASLHRTSPKIAAAYARASLKGGDLLLAIRGTYGRVAEVPAELEGGNITQDTARLDVTPLADHRYVAAHLRSEVSQAFFRRVARGVAVKGVNIGDVRLTPIALPPLAEQKEIVAEVERRLSVIEELEAAVEANLTRADRLRQSILSQAFNGKLLSNGARG